MKNRLIKPIDQELSEYLRDESRAVGTAGSISFPRCLEEVINVIKELYDQDIPVTIQGARTGLAGGAVPLGGHVMNLSRMNAVSGMEIGEDGRFTVRCEAGVVLSQLNKMIESRKFDLSKWNKDSREAYKVFLNAEEQFFSPDPTEASATIGGMVANNASGARSYLYGSTRDHVIALKIVLFNGDTLSLRRGQHFASGRNLSILSDQGYRFDTALPTYKMPETKNASGYYIEDDMDAIDLFIGSGGTLGIITEIEVGLLPAPKVIWGVNFCFAEEKQAIRFVETVRSQVDNIASLEFYDGFALAILRNQKEENPAFAKLRPVEKRINSVIYVELHCDDEEAALKNLVQLADKMKESRGDAKDTLVARTVSDRDSLYFFRHAVPESVNMLIDNRRKVNPVIKKLAADMAVPDRYLSDIMELYRTMLKQYDLEAAIWGHIGDNHLHVNILPRDASDYEKGQALYRKWSSMVSKFGGAVSAEHGIGKLKTDQLKLMYGEKHIEEMRMLKKVFDPHELLCPGNFFEIRKNGRIDCGGEDL